ncbi:MAG: hypothetical protein LBJ61_00455 [Deltaproteobacteria bacterium]|jgi:Rod binding domain-containing protein|nr:hypothetical protein [Deltaproteobacteria bacterium]
MTVSTLGIPAHSVPKEAFEAQKADGLSPRSGHARAPKGKPQATSGSRPVAVFTVEEFKKGVTIGSQGGSQGGSQVGSQADPQVGTQGEAQTTSGSRPVAVFTVEEFKKGVTIGSQSGSQVESQVGAEGGGQLATESNETPQGISLRDPNAGKIGTLSEDLPPGSYGRRYRPLDNGKLADASQRLNGLSEEQKLSKLKQIKESAEEYEGFLIAEMIKNMRQSPFVKTAGNDTYSEIAEKPFTAALTKAGGLGLSQTIVNQVAAQEGLGDVLSNHPEVMGPNWRQRLAPSQMPKPGPKLGTQAGTQTDVQASTLADSQADKLAGRVTGSEAAGQAADYGAETID